MDKGGGRPASSSVSAAYRHVADIVVRQVVATHGGFHTGSSGVVAGVQANRAAAGVAIAIAIAPSLITIASGLLLWRHQPLLRSVALIATIIAITTAATAIAAAIDYAAEVAPAAGGVGWDGGVGVGWGGWGWSTAIPASPHCRRQQQPDPNELRF